MIELDNVSFQYSESRHGVKKINLKIKTGECIVLTGKSGCGKTTVIRLINGLAPRYYKGTKTGDIYISGKNIETMPSYDIGRIVGSIFQDPKRQFFSSELEGEIAFGCENYGFSQLDIRKRTEDAIYKMGGLGNIYAPDGRIIQGALEPLAAGRGRKVDGQIHQLAGKTAGTLGSHGVTLVGHGGAANLLALKGFFLHLEVGQKPQIHRKLMRRDTDSGQGFRGFHVPLARIGLAGDGKALLKAQLGGDPAVQLAHLLMVAGKELKKGRLGADRALDAARLELMLPVFYGIQIHQQILNIQGRALAYGHRLGRLVMGIAQCRQSSVFSGKGCEIRNSPEQRRPDQLHGLTLDHQIRVTDHELRGCPQVDNGLGKRTLLTIGKDMRHDIMANFLFLGLGDLEVYIVRVCFHLGDHFGAHCRETHFVLGLGQGYPALAPVGEFVAFGKKSLHFPAGVAGNQRFLINIPVAFHVILYVA